MNPTPEQLAAQVALLVRTRPEARVIGMHTSGPWLGDAALKVNGQTLPVAYCTSALQMSAALVAHGPDDPPLIIMTPLEEHQLSLDVLARLAGRRLHHIDRWQMVRDLFCARDLDPRLLPHGWMADALLQHMPDGGYPPVASGWLDVDTVWTQLCQQYLGLASGRPDAVALVVWSLTESNVHRSTALSAALRTGLRQRVEETAGAVGIALLDALEAGYGTLLLPIGLACEILFAPEAGTHLGLAQARARLEPYVAGRMLSADVGHAWFAAAATALETLPAAEAPAWLERTEQFLADLKASEYRALSNILGSGFSQRLVQFASELQRWLRGKATLDQVENSFDHACRHRESTRQGARLGRVRMALRLARYLSTVQTDTRLTTLAQAAVAYAEQGGYVDWARRYLIGGDEIKELATAFSALCKRVQQVREQQNKQFAILLATWHTTPMAMAEFIPIEQALSRIVATLTRATPVLLLVIDGMGYAVFGELCDDLRRHGWVALTDQPGRALPSLVSVVPSVTELSRASLLAGSLTRGNSAAEKQRFATHADLLAVSRPGSPPLLFHKGDLAEGGATELSEIVREAMRDGHRKIVGVVINAVDDHLAKSDQLRLSWAIGQLQYLDALLYEAQLAGRAVVVTSDHGHVLETGTKKLAGGSEERWRPYDTTLAAEELVFEGPRIAQATGIQRCAVERNGPLC